MSVKFYLLTFTAICCIAYGIHSIQSMLFNCQSSYYVECVGIKLDENKVYAVSNNKSSSADTISLNYPQSKAIMPSTLGFLFFDKTTNSFVLKNNTCVFNPESTIPENYFLPFAHTLVGEDKFYSGSEVIPQNVLLDNGIKYNTAVGSRENRVSLQLLRFENDTYLKFKDDGVCVKYLARSDVQNKYDLFLNTPVRSNNKFLFAFNNTSADTGKYTINITPSTFSFNGSVTDSRGNTLQSLNGSTAKFDVAGYLFEVTPKYTKVFALFYCLFFILLVAFQTYFMFRFSHYESDVYKSLFSIRVLINCLVLLSTPLFLTSYFLGENRSYYLVLVVLLNLSYFTPKDLLHRIAFVGNLRFVNYIIFLVIIALVVILWKFTKNELFLGRVPILHIQKLVLLFVIFATQHTIFSKYKYGRWYRIVLVVAFSFVISLLTSDLGSCIYTALTFLLIELISKTIRLKTAVAVSLLFVVAISLLFWAKPSVLTGSKSYRIVAPYTQPDNKKLEGAKQSDRETYAGINYILKNGFNNSSPRFSQLNIPAPFRSTFHSDFAFLWSFTFGGYLFLGLFLVVISILLSDLLLLLYLCIRVVRIKEDSYFSLPSSREGELIRFYLAFTLIQFVYPVFFSLLLLPLTGQSLCALSISNWEIIFLTILLVALNSIFTNPAYFTTTAPYNYSFNDAKQSVRFVVLIFLSVLVSGILYKAISLSNTANSMQWDKCIKNEVELIKEIPSSTDKAQLVAYAKKIIGDDNLACVATKKKPILKELASRYYSGKPYRQVLFESKNYSNSTKKISRQTSLDSLFAVDRKLLSGKHAPFGKVYAASNIVNNKPFSSVSHNYYSSIPYDAETIIPDLTAECSKLLESHLQSIGIPSNIGSIMIVNNKTGGVIVNSTMPLDKDINSNEVHYIIGSLKKTLLAYCAIIIEESYKLKRYDNQTFEEFIKTSNDYYAASLLKDLLTYHPEEFDRVLQDDFGLPLFSETDDSFLDIMPTPQDFSNPLDRNNTIYRQAIGQQRPYKFVDVVQWYARITSKTKLQVNYLNDEKNYERLSIPLSAHDFLQKSLNSVLRGTAYSVGTTLKQHNIDTKQFICKTGTAEKPDKSSNSSSSFVIANEIYTIGIMLKGTIPHNREKLAAQHLFNKLVPILLKYEILTNQ